MSGFFSAVFVISTIVVVITLIIALVAFLRKKPHRKYLKIAGVSAIIGITSLVCSMATQTPEERAAQQQRAAERQAEKDRLAAEKQVQKEKEEADKQTYKNQEDQSSEEPATDDETEVEEVDEQEINESSSATNAIDDAIGETIAEMEDNRYHPMVKDAFISVDHESKLVTMTIAVNAATNKKTALDLADTMIRQFSSNVSLHDSSFTQPSSDRYGSLFDEYDIAISVAPIQYVENPSKWLYNKRIAKGMHTKQGPAVK